MRQKPGERDDATESIKRARIRQIGAICKIISKEGKQEGAKEKGVNCWSE